jgi:hypothetical protein
VAASGEATHGIGTVDEPPKTRICRAFARYVMTLTTGWSGFGPGTVARVAAEAAVAESARIRAAAGAAYASSVLPFRIAIR